MILGVVTCRWDDWSAQDLCQRINWTLSEKNVFQIFTGVSSEKYNVECFVMSDEPITEEEALVAAEEAIDKELESPVEFIDAAEHEEDNNDGN
jgi:hypothetical protein